jgi:hypothetical protein
MSRKIRKNIRENVGALDDKTKIFKNFKITWKWQKMPKKVCFIQQPEFVLNRSFVDLWQMLQSCQEKLRLS